MNTYIALLRGINVGGSTQVSMADLRDLLTELGLADARSLLRTGNLVFRSGAPGGAPLERLLEAGAEKRLDLRADFFVRTVDEWRRVVARNPFREEAERDPAHLVALFLKSAPAAADVDALRASITGPEVVHADGTHAYLVYPDGIGRSRLTNTLIERKLGTRATGRNWNTVLKLGTLAEG